MTELIKQTLKKIKYIAHIGNSILSLTYFRMFYTKPTKEMILKIEQLNIIDPDWESDVPSSYEEYLELIIVLKLHGLRIKNIQKDLKNLNK